MKQDLGTNANVSQDITSGTSNGSMDKKETSPDCFDPLHAEHAKEQATPSTGIGLIFTLILKMFVSIMFRTFQVIHRKCRQQRQQIICDYAQKKHKI